MKKLVIIRIPVLKTSNYVAGILVLVSLIFEILHGAPRDIQDKSVFYVLGSMLIAAFFSGLGSWLTSAVTLAMYNRLARKFGGIHVFVDIDEDRVEPAA